MNKMKKLLSVVLALVLALSCMSVVASAAPTAYKTVANLEALNAYSPYGQVTRLSTEERASMIQDFLDNVLPGLNINMGTVLDVLGLKITINFTSVDNVCISIDSFKDTFDNTLFSIAAGIVNLGILESLNFDTWNTGIDRAGDAQLTLFAELFQLLSNNTTVVSKVLTDGLDLGIVGGLIGGLDLSSIQDIVTNLPKLAKDLIFPLFNRWDDTLDEVNALETAISGSGSIKSFLGGKVGNYFQKPMSMTTVKADVNGNMTSDHVLPTEGTRRIHAISADKKTITVSEYQTQRVVDKNKEDDIVAVGYLELDDYVLQPEVVDDAGNPVEGTDYVYKCKLVDADGEPILDDEGNQTYGETLKFYKPGSYWLKDFKADGGTIDITAESGAALLYKMIPYVFDAMAPVVVNGSIKKLLAELFGTQWKFVGNVTDEEALAEIQALPGYNASLEIFGEQGEYLWEWSAFDKITVDGVDYFYYRFQDDLYVGDTAKCNDYFNIINWDYEITGDFFNEFIPTGSTGSETSAAGYTRLLHGFNDFIVKVANAVLVNGAKDIAGTKTLSFTLTKGDNSNLVGNMKALAQALLGFHPEHIFGETYDAEGNVTGYGSYYSLIVENTTNDDLVLTGIAALVIDALAPQMHLPDAASLQAQNVKVGGLLAAMLRELATQIVPSINYDALIYSDYNTMTFVAGKDNSYWLDVLLTIGTDMGYKYLTAFADMNEDALADGFAKGGYIDWQLERTYTEADLKLDSAVNLWEQRVDFIIDWALYVDTSATFSVWNMNNFVQEYLDAAGLTYDVATPEDPFKKVDAIFDNILFIDQFTSETDLEAGLRGTILDLVDLNWENILGTESEKGILDIPADSKLRTTNIVDAISLEVRDLINGLFKNIGGGSYYFIPESITTIDALLTQDNIKTIAVNLIGKLETAYNNGLLVTVAPFLNFLLGWKTDPQVIADPVINMTNRDGNDYTFVWSGSQNYPAIEETKISFTNNSSGMLEKHRNSSVTDHEYQIVIDSVTSDASVNKVTFNVADSTASPYETVTINVGGTYNGPETVMITIAYHYVGKDGQPVGGTQYASIVTLITNLYEDTNLEGRADGDGDKDYTGIDPFKKYQFTEDIYTTVTTYKPTIFYVSASLSNPSKSFEGITAPDTSTDQVFKGTSVGYATESDCKSTKITGSSYYDVYESVTKTFNMNALAATYFDFITSQSEAGWAGSISKDGATAGYLYKAKSGVTAETEFPYGNYDMGQTAVKYGSDSKVWRICYVYYTDYGIEEVKNNYVGMGLTINDVDTTDAEAVAAWNTYLAALKNVVRLATYPHMTTMNSATSASDDYISSIMPQLEPAIETIDEAYEALVPFMEEKASDGAAEGASSGIGLLDAQLALDDGDGETEVNFQDYAYYEYFNYADLRTAARNLSATYVAPEIMDTYYILGSGIREAELNKVIAAEKNANKAKAITATRSENDELAVQASIKANAEFEAPANTYLYLADFASRLAYYKTFLAANAVAADLTFLNKEIGYAEANYPMSDEALYTAASWASYKEAYDDAKAITASNLPSEVFAAKYNLMVQMKNLLLKSESAIEAGATAELIALAAKAEAVFEMNYDDIVLSDVALAKDLTKDEALGHLLYALGYYYEGEDGNTWNLYENSAYQYIDNDRPNKSTGIDRIDACAANLDACLAYFDLGEEALPELGVVDGTTGAIGEVVVDEETGFTTGYLFGVTAGEAAEGYFALVDETAGTVEWTVGNASSVNGTGAIATVKDTNGNAVAEFTLVIFGDVNGDAAITAADANLVANVTVGGNITGEPNNFAADANGDASISAADANIIANVTVGGNITANPYAA